MNTMYEEFYKKAGILGHDAVQLAAGEMVVTYGRFPDLDEGRRLLSMATDEQRAARLATFFNPPILSRQRLGQGIHDRGEAYVFAGGVVKPSDWQGLGNHFPARIKSISVLSKTIRAGETWDVSVRGSVFGIDDLEELYTTVNVGELIIEPGAKLTVQGNVFTLLCQRLVCLPSPEGDYQLGILPTPFSVDTKSGDMDGKHGLHGRSGVQGNDGEMVQVTSSLLGYRLNKDILQTDLHGQPGEDGEDGTPAGHGRNGGMCKLAEITIRHLTGHLTVFAQAGQGGEGGSGGDGGHGGNGGDGSPGYKLIKNVLQSGQGGDGGTAGQGGQGGNGGNGGVASNVYINVPLGQHDQVTCISLASQGGKGGLGGKAGKAGSPGKGGLGFAPASDGLAGASGENGKNGLDGRGRPAPWLFVNEQHQSG